MDIFDQETFDLTACENKLKTITGPESLDGSFDPIGFLSSFDDLEGLKDEGPVKVYEWSPREDPYHVIIVMIDTVTNDHRVMIEAT